MVRAELQRLKPQRGWSTAKRVGLCRDCVCPVENQRTVNSRQGHLGFGAPPIPNRVCHHMHAGTLPGTLPCSCFQLSLH